jgi:tetratricopeptide (TPR) repeat protein
VCKDFSPSKIFVIFAPKMKHLLTVIAVLLAFASCTTEADRDRMEALLDRADSMNRAYIPMTDGIDSLLLEATRYYDRHGDANQQMRAHYLLGCAYRDMGEAPAALQSYQDAIDRADTLSDDCDYPRLMSVYGQMAELFHAQNLPHDELAQRKKIGDYALLVGDTLSYIRNLELYVKPYFLMGDTAAMLSSLQQAQHLYSAYGYHHEAAAIYGTISLYWSG